MKQEQHSEDAEGIKNNILRFLKRNKSATIDMMTRDTRNSFPHWRRSKVEDIIYDMIESGTLSVNQGTIGRKEKELYYATE
jgi:hypothetical protein